MNSVEELIYFLSESYKELYHDENVTYERQISLIDKMVDKANKLTLALEDEQYAIREMD